MKKETKDRLERLGEKRAAINRTLTPRQSEILDVIKGHICRFGYAPSIAEINEAFGFSSPNAAYQHVLLIARKGYLTRGREARSIKLNDSPDR